MSDKTKAPLTETNRAEIAVALVIFLSGRSEDLQQFLGVSGLDGSELRTRLDDSGFQQGLFDYISANEPLLLAFCEETGRDPAQIAQLSHNLANSGDWM